MKIKNLLLMAAVAGITFTSCDLEDLGTTSVNTELEVDMPITAETAKSASEEFPFKGNGSINLSDNEDLEDHLDNFRGFTAEEGTTFKVEYLPDGVEIYSVTLEVKVGESSWTTLSTYSKADGYKNGDNVTINTDDVSAINTAFGTWENSDFKDIVKFKVEGSSNQELDPGMVSVETPPGIKLKVKAKVEVGL